MLQILTKEESKRLNREMLAWVKQALDGPHGTHVYNILLQLKNLLRDEGMGIDFDKS